MTNHAMPDTPIPESELPELLRRLAELESNIYSDPPNPNVALPQYVTGVFTPAWERSCANVLVEILRPSLRSIRELLARRKAMEDAPHAPMCDSLKTRIVRVDFDDPAYNEVRNIGLPCNCWKSKWSAK